MQRLIAALGAAALLAAGPALAALKVGAKAPDFSTQASVGGKPFPFKLSQALRKGPVVLYFFPAAFTTGCTIEAHQFAEASDEFKANGATLIGLTAGNIDRVTEFSVSECRSKFAVAADPKAAVAKRYDALFPNRAELSDRTSYVIAPNGKIIFVHSDLKPDEHVALTLAAVKKWRAEHPK
ncbi:MAG TPA: peroxiredoxin [Caulobacteraceae bacterium]|nr:peroxiredoxin [Caulobacteraceae bacterium]